MQKVMQKVSARHPNTADPGSNASELAGAGEERKAGDAEGKTRGRGKGGWKEHGR